MAEIQYKLMIINGLYSITEKNHIAPEILFRAGGNSAFSMRKRLNYRIALQNFIFDLQKSNLMEK